jgi:hypothetical protein
MIADPCFHCWRDAKRLVNPAEVVVHVVKRDRRFQILNLFRESIGQSREAAHGHSHREILALKLSHYRMVRLLAFPMSKDNHSPEAAPLH